METPWTPVPLDEVKDHIRWLQEAAEQVEAGWMEAVRYEGDGFNISFRITPAASGRSKLSRQRVSTTKGRKFHPQALTTAEVEALMAACSPTSPTGKRNRALIVVLWRGALRCEEALHLKVHDLDRATGNIRVMFGKGRQARTVGISPRSWAVLEVWLTERERLGVSRSVPLFCTITSGKYHGLSSRYVRWLMADLGIKAGIGKRTAPHQLRHSRASEAADEGVPVHQISTFLGHSNVGTTDRYIQHLNPRAAIDAMLASRWDQEETASEDSG